MACKTFIITLFCLFILQNGFTQENADQNQPDFPNTTVCLFEACGIHRLILKDSTLAEEFEKFVRTEFVPAFANQFPGLEYLIMKGDRGKEQGSYILIPIFDTIERRDFYFPIPGQGFSVEGQKIWETAQLQDIWDRCSEYATSRWMVDYTLIK